MAEVKKEKMVGLWVRKLDNTENVKIIQVPESKVAEVSAEYASKGYIVL